MNEISSESSEMGGNQRNVEDSSRKRIAISEMAESLLKWNCSVHSGGRTESVLLGNSSGWFDERPYKSARLGRLRVATDPLRLSGLRTLQSQ
jgi:hypothetical protein